MKYFGTIAVQNKNKKIMSWMISTSPNSKIYANYSFFLNERIDLKRVKVLDRVRKIKVQFDFWSQADFILSYEISVPVQTL